MVRNKALVFKQIPNEYPVPGQDLTVVVGSFNLQKDPPPGGLTVKTLYASLDPYHRACMSVSGLFPLMYPLKIGKPLASLSIVRVLKSYDRRFKSGDLITGLLAIQEYSIIQPEWTDFYAPIINPYELELPIFLGILGIPGLTAFGSFHETRKSFEKNETIFVSSAAGAVGHFVGQIAKNEGLTVIGSVGTDEKLDYIVNILEFDGGFNYNKEKPRDALRRLVPDGIDIYHDNVGGEQLDAALEFLKPYGRIMCCGMISDYNKRLDEKYRVKNLLNVSTKDVIFEGFSVTDFFKKTWPNYPLWAEQFAWRLSCGLFKTSYYEIHGIENGPRGFVAMLKGEGIGNWVIKFEDN